MSKKLTFLPPGFRNNEKPKKMKTDFKITKDSKNLKFIINQKIEFYSVNKIIVDTETEMIWLLDYLSTNQIKIAQAKHEVLKVNPVYNNMVSFAQIFNYPLAEVLLNLNSDGSINSIENQEEIFSRWNELKKNHLDEKLDIEVKKDIFKKGDDDFSASLEVVKGSILFNFLVADIYGKKEVRPHYNKVGERSYLSNIFTQKPIDCIVNEKVNYINNDIIEVSRLISNKSTNKEIEEFYSANFKEIFKESLDYSFTIDQKYQFNESKGSLISLSVSLKEIANKKLHYSTNINYKLIDDNE